jgi:hypothetical protein
LPRHDLFKYEGLAEQAWSWLTEPGDSSEPLQDHDLVASRHIVRAWLKSGLDRKEFCRKHDLNVGRFNERFDDICALIAADLNEAGVPVPKRARHPLFGRQILSGMKAIASHLGYTIDGVVGLIKDGNKLGKLTVAMHNGVVIANADFITRWRKHRARSGGNTTQQAPF